MKPKIFFLFFITILLAACTAGQAPVQLHSFAPADPLQPHPRPPPATKPFLPTVTEPPALVPTPTPKPPLAKDAWMQMPAVPTGVSDKMRDIYERGLTLGN